jgi:hypothetical protein
VYPEVEDKPRAVFRFQPQLAETVAYRETAGIADSVVLKIARSAEALGS